MNLIERLRIVVPNSKVHSIYVLLQMCCDECTEKSEYDKRKTNSPYKAA
jgi:hypothetical protein